MDALTALINVRVFDASFDADAMLASHDVFTGASSDHVNGFLSGLAAYFMDTARQPPPPGLPTLRDFQKHQGAAVINWLRERLSVAGSALTADAPAVG